VIKYGFADFRSMFYDQIWINYVPALYDNYFILKHPGYIWQTGTYTKGSFS
jgi:hypothetical protein